ncbi:MAG: HAD family phosphatase [Chitinophagaceae bacterium]
MQKIKNIIFDLGGVFIDIDFDKTRKAFEASGITDYAAKFSQHHVSPLFQEFETGKLSAAAFLDGFRETFHTTLSDAEITQAWNAMLGHFSPEKIEWLEQVNQRYRTYLFSNTNIIHQQQFEPQFVQEIGHPIHDYFLHIYYSHDLGLRKPSVASFEKILAEQQLDKNETLFIDDTIGNIEGADQAGLSTFFLDLANGKKLQDIPL